jgi:hypothetical protein
MGQVTTMFATTFGTGLGVASTFDPKATFVPSIFNSGFAPQAGWRPPAAARRRGARCRGARTADKNDWQAGLIVSGLKQTNTDPT